MLQRLAQLILGDPFFRPHVLKHAMRTGDGGVHVIGEREPGRRLGQGGEQSGFLKV